MNCYKTKHGFTLIETVLAVALVAIVVASFLGMFTFGYDTVFSMGRETVATRIAEECLGLYYSQYSSATMTAEPSSINSSIAVIASGKPGYTIEPRVITDNHTNGLDLVTVVVKYRNGTRSVTLSALIP